MTDSDINTDNMEIFGGNDFVLTQQRDADGKIKIVSGGYKIKSLFLQGGTSIMTTINNGEQDGGKVSSPFENLAVPAGLFYVNMRVPKKDLNSENQEHFKHHETISDDMIDKLYSLVEIDKKRKRKTRKHNIKTNKTKSRRLK